MPDDGQPRGIDIFMLDVGQGDATLIIPPRGEADAVLFDCRDAHVVEAALAQKHVDRLEAVIISHLDIDHIAGIPDILLKFGDRIGTVYITDDRPITDADPGAATAKKTIDAVRSGASDGLWESVPAIRYPPHMTVAEGSDWSIRLIAPTHAATLDRAREGHWEEPNRYSAVVRVEMGDHAVLIGGDAPLATWAALPDAERSASIFRIPHHGGAIDDGGVPDGWSVARLYQGVNVGVVSVGTRNDPRWGHPRPEWVEPISRGTCRMMCTQATPRCQSDIRGDEAGPEHRDAVLDLFAERNLAAEPLWRHYRDANLRRGKHRLEVPCAGTVVVSVRPDAPPQVLPSVEQHGSIVDLWEHPLCRPLPQP